MLKIIDFAKLSHYVYFNILSSDLPSFVKTRFMDQEHFTISNLKSGIYEVVIDKLIQSLHAEQHPFYASFFVKVANQKAVGAVIAIRGTVPMKLSNDAQDVISWWKSIFDENANIKLPQSYLGHAQLFYTKARKFMREKLELPLSKLFVTGHSLGGAIAALMPAYDRLPLRAITFNAPGIRQVPNIHLTTSQIINIRSQYDFISAIDYPIGPCVAISVAQQEVRAKKAFAIASEHQREGWSRLDIINDVIETADFFESVVAQHSMGNLLSSLEKLTNNELSYQSFLGIENIVLNNLPLPFHADYTPKLLASFSPNEVA